MPQRSQRHLHVVGNVEVAILLTPLSGYRSRLPGTNGVIPCWLVRDESRTGRADSRRATFDKRKLTINDQHAIAISRRLDYTDTDVHSQSGQQKITKRGTNSSRGQEVAITCDFVAPKKEKTPSTSSYCERSWEVVRGGVEPPTPGFSVLCSTN